MTLALLLKNWKLALSGLALLAILGLWLAYSHAQQVARAQKVRLEVASRQVVVQTVATKAVDAVATKTAQVTERTYVVTKTIQAAPGADAPIPPAVRDAWLAGLSDDPGSSDYRTGKPKIAVR